MTDYSMFNSLNSAKTLTPSQQQMLFQERMSNTAHTREIEDLKNAGLNPILSANHSGASTPSGASSDKDPSVENPLYALISTVNKATGSSAKTAQQALGVIKGLTEDKSGFNFTGDSEDKNGNLNISSPSQHSNSDRNNMAIDVVSNIGKGSVGEGLKMLFDFATSYIAKNIPDAKTNKNGQKEAGKLVPEVYQIPFVGKSLKGMLDSVARNTGKDLSVVFNNPYPLGVASGIGKIISNNSAKKNLNAVEKVKKLFE